ncbi:MAG TPA: CpsB/CapC family capsule biosynthesis tyrosine phosphatase [Armatimonadota bacterium]|jgi:protein-tyrosine phosphatase
MVDLHTHVMYGWDDGADTIETSMVMARLAAAAGTRTLAATPHLRYQEVLVDAQMIRDRVAEINAAIQAEGLEIEIVTGAEVPASWDNLALIQNGKALCLGESRTVLFEMPFRTLPVRMDELVFQLRMAGFTPLIAHPERCQPFLMEPGLVERTIAEDIPVQITTSSLVGSMGGKVRDLAWRIMEQPRPIVVASDAHGVDHRRPVMSDAFAELESAFGAETADLFCRANPAALLANKPPRLAALSRDQEPPARRSLASRLRRALRGE